MNTNQTAICNSLSDLLRYPDGVFVDKVTDCSKLLRGTESSAHLLVEKFSGLIKKKSVEELEELFTRTFDLNPPSALEVGWHLYGESYERGDFIVKMRQVLKQFGIPESKELPDHLMFVLIALGQMEQADAKTFSNKYILPALGKMLNGLKDKDNPYENILRAISEEVKSSFGLQKEGVENG